MLQTGHGHPGRFPPSPDARRPAEMWRAAGELPGWAEAPGHVTDAAKEPPVSRKALPQGPALAPRSAAHHRLSAP
jgi:hypothetical protein